MPVIIRSRRDGFRRCGVAHPADPVEYPDDRFTAEELEKLQKEPMLIVQVVKTNEGKRMPQKDLEEEPKKNPDESAASEVSLAEGHLDKVFLESMEYPELKRLAAEMKLPFKGNISKPALVELIAGQVCQVPKDHDPEGTDLAETNPKDSGKQDDSNQQALSHDVSGADQ